LLLEDVDPIGKINLESNIECYCYYYFCYFKTVFNSLGVVVGIKGEGIIDDDCYG